MLGSTNLQMYLHDHEPCLMNHNGYKRRQLLWVKLHRLLGWNPAKCCEASIPDLSFGSPNAVLPNTRK